MTTTKQYTIRPAKEHEISLLGSIEHSAGQLFRTVGLESLAESDTLPAEVHRACFDQRLLWVVCYNHDDQSVSPSPVAFLAAKLLENGSQDGKFLHIVELSVHADHQRKGLAKSLLHAVETEAIRINTFHPFPSSSLATLPPPSIETDHNLDTSTTSLDNSGWRFEKIRGLSLTTYRHLDFNAKFYAKFGFEEVSVDGIERIVGVAAKQIWDEEQSQLPLPHKRCWMIKFLPIVEQSI